MASPANIANAAAVPSDAFTPFFEIQVGSGYFWETVGVALLALVALSFILRMFVLAIRDLLSARPVLYDFLLHRDLNGLPDQERVRVLSGAADAETEFLKQALV